MSVFLLTAERIHSMTVLAYTALTGHLGSHGLAMMSNVTVSRDKYFSLDLLFAFIRMYTCVCISCDADTQEGQKSPSDPLELKVVVSCLA